MNFYFHHVQNIRYWLQSYVSLQTALEILDYVSFAASKAAGVPLIFIIPDILAQRKHFTLKLINKGTILADSSDTD